MQYKQYTFMQIQKEIECSGQFNDFIELEFKFKDLDEELSDHETYNGIDNFTKYFIRYQWKRRITFWNSWSRNYVIALNEATCILDHDQMMLYEFKWKSIRQSFDYSSGYHS